MKINCAYDEMVDLTRLVENPKNPNKHPERQIELLAKIISYQGQRSPIIVSTRSGFIVKGHGRLAAIRKLGWEKAAVDFQDYDDEAQEFSDMVADNKIAELAEHDDALMIEGIKELDIADLELLGLDQFDLEAGARLDEDDVYTRKVESPIYEPTGEKPALNELFNTEKTDQLIEEIEKSKVPSEIKYFLRLAAHRHTKFNYKHIAEYYCHCPKEEQLLFEKSALVVIDFDQAIAQGFVQLTEAVRANFAEESKNDAS